LWIAPRGQIRERITIEGETKPACVAMWITMLSYA